MHQLNYMTTEELVDLVNQELTINCSLPKYLSDDAITRIITQAAYRFFYREYRFALHRTFYFINYSEFVKANGGTKVIILPNEIQSVSWVYKTNAADGIYAGYGGGIGGAIPGTSGGSTGMNYGLSLGTGTMNGGIYSFAHNVSEFAEYAAVLGAFSDSLKQFSKQTIASNYNPNTKQLTMRGAFNSNLVLDVHANIPPEFLHSDPLFIEWVTATSMIELGRLLTFTTAPLIGGGTINGDKIYEMGNTRKEKVEEKIKKGSSMPIIFMRTR